jgi:hypothetical protein
MGRLVALLAVLVVASVADAKTPMPKCRKACKPLVSSVCPEKGKALRKCRAEVLRECRRDGVAACALGLPTAGPGDGTTTPTTTPGSTTTFTTLPASVTTTTTPGSAPTTTTTTPGSAPTTTTTTLPPPSVPAVGGNWTFDGVLAQAGCNLNYDIVSSLAVLQDGSTLYGTMEGRAAAGTVNATGWSFAWNVGNLQAPDATCTQSFLVAVTGVTSPAAAEGTASASCTDGSTCQARWTGSVTRVP